MRIDRRLTFIGVLLIVLSMTMATQYAVTRVGFEYNIVHPSDADIRFIGSDNSSDNIRVLRAVSNDTNTAIKIVLGDFFAGQNKTYTAAFGIVNEEPFAVNITHINVSTDEGDYMEISLHGNRTLTASSDSTSVKMWNQGSGVSASTSTAWQLGPGDQNTSSMNGTDFETLWDDGAGIRYSVGNSTAINGSSDYVWVEVSVNLPQSPDTGGAHDGAIFVHFEATTIT